MRAFCKVAPGVPKMVSFLLGARFLSYSSANYVHVCTSTHSTLIFQSPCHAMVASNFYVPPKNLLAFFSSGAHRYYVYRLQSSTNYVFVVVQANMLEGGGKTPILSPLELEDIGFKIVVYPLSLVGVSIRAMQVYIQQRLFFEKMRLLAGFSFLVVACKLLSILPEEVFICSALWKFQLYISLVPRRMH